MRDVLHALGLTDPALGLTLDVAGDGPDRPACERLTIELGLVDRVRFHGRLSRTEVDTLYRDADIFVFPSFREAGGNVAFEAMGWGLPLIVSDIGGPGAAVDDSCGIRIHPERPEQYARDIAEAIVRLARDPVLRRRLGDAARSRVTDVGLWDSKIDRIDALYRDLVDGPRAERAEVDVAVVVVTYNSAAVVGELLESLPAALGSLHADVVVVDNGSTDETCAVVAARDDCRLVRSTNTGYAAGINRGVEHARAADAILVLNPDVRLTPGSVERMAAELSRPGVGVVAPQIRNPDGGLARSLRREPTLLRALGLTRTGLPALSEYVGHDSDYLVGRCVDWALGAVLLVSSECHGALGRVGRVVLPVLGRDRFRLTCPCPRLRHVVRTRSTGCAHRCPIGNRRPDPQHADPQPGPLLQPPSRTAARLCVLRPRRRQRALTAPEGKPSPPCRADARTSIHATRGAPMRQDTGTQLTEPSTCGEPDEPSLVVRSRPDFDPGVVAVSTGAGPFLGVHSSCGRFDAWQQGFLDPLESDRVVSLSLLRRRHDVDVDDDDVRGQDSPTGGGLDGVAPPFAATHMARDGSVLRAITDSLGFRHLYAHQAEDSAYISTSAHRLSPLTGNRIDPVGIAQLCNLGWQIGTRTSFDGITKLPPQSTVSLQGGRAVVVREPRPQSELTSDVDCARAAASILRSSMERLLDDHPDAILQLTGGLDSRLLLAAIPAERRRDVDVLTLAVPGSQDLTIAKDLAARFGMGHHVISMSGLEALEPVEAFGRSCAAARHLDCAADPLGYAALGFAEGGTDDRLRIAGLGGEVARGFYYFGPPRTVPVSRERVERLARWRMFPNESVPLDVLQPSFGAWARESTIDSIHEAFLDFDTDWFRATDEFYLLQRMQRWAGVLATADCMRRTVVNPMLDHRFLDIVRSAPPTAKRNARGCSVASLSNSIRTLPTCRWTVVRRRSLTPGVGSGAWPHRWESRPGRLPARCASASRAVSGHRSALRCSRHWCSPTGAPSRRRWIRSGRWRSSTSGGSTRSYSAMATPR